MPRKLLVTSTRCLVSLSLSFLLAVPDVARAAPQAPAPAPAKLNIVIVEGEGAINNIRQRTAREPIVQVEDENHRPVAGAAVLFLLPENGPGGASLTARGVCLLPPTARDGRWPKACASMIQGEVPDPGRGFVYGTDCGRDHHAGQRRHYCGGCGWCLRQAHRDLGGRGRRRRCRRVVATRKGGGGVASTPTPTPTTISPGTPSVGKP